MHHCIEYYYEMTQEYVKDLPNQSSFGQLFERETLR